ncbi:MAG TPA: hypothetical protein VEI97_19235, partial [bacterium]|nr:hypothetical protein [bacterium]
QNDDATPGTQVFRGLGPVPQSAAGWQTHVALEGAGGFTSSVMAFGTGVAILHASGGSLLCTRTGTLTPSGPGDWATHTVDATASPASMSGATVRGQLCAVYVTGLSEVVLRFVFTSKSAPSVAGDWQTHQMVEGEIGARGHPALVSLDNRAVVGKFSDRTGDYMVFKATNAEPTSHTHWQFIGGIADLVTRFGERDSLAVVNGRLVLGATANFGDGLLVARPLVANPTGNADWDVQAADLITPFGFDPSLTQHGNKIIAVHRRSNGDGFRVVRALGFW